MAFAFVITATRVGTIVITIVTNTWFSEGRGTQDSRSHLGVPCQTLLKHFFLGILLVIQIYLAKQFVDCFLLDTLN